MPEAMERKLKQVAAKRGLSKERTNAFVYGTMRKTGWKPKMPRTVGSRKNYILGNKRGSTDKQPTGDNVTVPESKSTRGSIGKKSTHSKINIPGSKSFIGKGNLPIAQTSRNEEDKKEIRRKVLRGRLIKGKKM